MSLRWRIAVGLAVIAGIVCALAATGAYLTTKRAAAEQHRRVPRDSHTERERRPGIRRTPSTRSAPGLQRRLPATRRSATRISGADRRRPTGRSPSASSGARRCRSTSDRRSRPSRLDGTSYRMLTVDVARGRCHPDRPRPERDRGRARGLRLRLLLLALGGVVAAAALGWWLAAAHREARGEASRHRRADRQHTGPVDADTGRRRRGGGEPALAASRRWSTPSRRRESSSSA